MKNVEKKFVYIFHIFVAATSLRAGKIALIFADAHENH